MDHDEPTEFPLDGYAADHDGWFAEPEETQLPDLGLGHERSGDDIGVDPEVEGGGDPPDDTHLSGDTASEDVDDVTDLVDYASDGTLEPDHQEPVPGTDPDLNPFADDETWNVDPFPEALSFDDPPEPVDGMPWADPDLLGDPDGRLPDPAADHQDPPPVSDLYAYDAADPVPGDPDPWASLVDSDDPATGSLARFWSTNPAP